MAERRPTARLRCLISGCFDLLGGDGDALGRGFGDKLSGPRLAGGVGEPGDEGVCSVSGEPGPGDESESSSDGSSALIFSAACLAAACFNSSMTDKPPLFSGTPSAGGGILEPELSTHCSSSPRATLLQNLELGWTWGEHEGQS